MTEADGTRAVRDGILEYIQNEKGEIEHATFVDGGEVNGVIQGATPKKMAMLSVASPNYPDQRLMIEHACPTHHQDDFKYGRHFYTVLMKSDEVNCSFVTDGLTIFCDQFLVQLKNLEKTLEGEAFLPFDGPPEVRLSCAVGKTGRVSWRAMASIPDKFKIVMSFENDQTFLPEFLRSVENLIFELMDSEFAHLDYRENPSRV